MSKRRLQFDVAPGLLKELDELKGKAHASSRAELVRDALRIYRWLLERRAAGYTLQLRKGKSILSIELLT